MTIVKDEAFTTSLKSILRYIAKDGKARAGNFYSQLFASINTIPDMPYKYRKSLYRDDENVRDMVFKGYTIPYKVDIENQKIVLLDIFKWVER